jgi:DNA mismatch endonuclease (patch repair protein)
MANRLARERNSCIRTARFACTPKSRREFWLPKFATNVARDRLVTRTLRKAGWNVVRIWECGLSRCRHARVARKLQVALGAQRRKVGR